MIEDLFPITLLRIDICLYIFYSVDYTFKKRILCLVLDFIFDVMLVYRHCAINKDIPSCVYFIFNFIPIPQILL